MEQTLPKLKFSIKAEVEVVGEVASQFLETILRMSLVNQGYKVNGITVTIQK